MTKDQLQETENEGRAFADAMLVIDPNPVVVYNCAKVVGSARYYWFPSIELVTRLLPSLDFRELAKQIYAVGFGQLASYNAFLAGAVSAIEAYKARQQSEQGE